MNEPLPLVCVVDDDEAVRSSLRLLLRSAGLNVRAFASAHEFLMHFDAEQPGCLVLDVRMPAMSGLELQRELVRRGACLPVLLISGHGDVPMAVEAIQQGAFDFLPKPFRDDELIERVQRALREDGARRRRLLEHRRLRERFDSLTSREREVLRLVTAGSANKSAAAGLGISQRTVEIHRARVMEKMGADSLAELVRMAIELDGEVAAPAGATG